MLKLDPGVLGGEPPGSGSFGLVALGFQGGNLFFSVFLHLQCAGPGNAR